MFTSINKGIFKDLRVRISAKILFCVYNCERVCRPLQYYFGIIPDLRVTHLTLSSEVQSRLPESLWDQFCWRMNVPDSTQNVLRSQYPSDKERKAEVVKVIAAEHPHLAKECVLDVLYRTNSLAPSSRQESLPFTCKYLSLSFTALAYHLICL